MMYFIELSQFSMEDSSLTKGLREQMGLSKGNAVRWAEWHADQAGPDSWPDVTLINAARLDWRPLCTRTLSITTWENSGVTSMKN